MTSRPITVDRGAGVIRGFVVAMSGAFRDGRGRFDADSLAEIVAAGNAAPSGLASNFNHDDILEHGLGRFLGRARKFSLNRAKRPNGEIVDAVRADLHLDPSAHKTPLGNLADYVMTLAQSDQLAIMASLVLHPKRIPDRNGGPDLWAIDRLIGVDLVQTGAATFALLSPSVSDADELLFRQRRAKARSIRSQIEDIDEEIRAKYAAMSEQEMQDEIALRIRRNRNHAMRYAAA